MKDIDKSNIIAGEGYQKPMYQEKKVNKKTYHYSKAFMFFLAFLFAMFVSVIAYGNFKSEYNILNVLLGLVLLVICLSLLIKSLSVFSKGLKTGENDMIIITEQIDKAQLIDEAMKKVNHEESCEITLIDEKLKNETNQEIVKQLKRELEAIIIKYDIKRAEIATNYCLH